MSKKIKNFAITILVIALIIGIFTIIGNSSKSTDNGSLVSNKGSGIATNANDQVQNDEFSAVLSGIKNIDIDTSVFSDPSFQAFRDFPISLGTDTVGRVNPFAPIGSDKEAVFADIQFQTIQPIEITKSTATLGAQINIPGSADFVAVFEYGVTDSFGTSTGPVSFTKNGTALFPISELLPAKKYFVRAMLVNGADVITGNTMTFTTKTN